MTGLITLRLWARLLLMQVLLLLITITIESWVFHRKQKWSQRLSVQYATINNLFATAFGWLFFFSLEPFLQTPLQELFIRISLFKTPSSQEDIVINNVEFVMIYLAIFLFNTIIKRIGIELIQALLSPSEAVIDRPLKIAPVKLYLSYKKQKQQKQQQGHDTLPSLSGTIIVATFLSQLTACLILLLLINYFKIRFWMRG